MVSEVRRKKKKMNWIEQKRERGWVFDLGYCNKYYVNI